MSGFRVASPPTAEPLHLNEIKAQLRLQHDSEDALLSAYLTASRQLWEDIAGRALVAQTITLTRSSFPHFFILPRSPAVAVANITYIDGVGVTQSVSTADYVLDTFSEPNRVVLAYTASWPSARCDVNAVSLTYTAGYATPFTVDAGTDICTFRGRSPVANESFQLWNSGGVLPGGLAGSTVYYVVNVSGQTCKLSLSQGGAAVDITSTGHGLHFAGLIPQAILDELKLWVGNRYEQREGFISQAPKLVLSHNYRLYGAG